MYTSDDKAKRRMLVTALFYTAATLFCIVFNAVYTHFSFGQRSDFMMLMCLFPLAGGVLPAIIAVLTPLSRQIGRVAFNIWNSAIAVFVCGCSVRGIINISGRFTDYDIYFYIVGAIMLTAATALICARAFFTKNSGTER